MPTAADIAAATPTCPGRKLAAGQWDSCDRPMRWRHDRATWICPLHGAMVTVDQAEHLDETPA